MNLDRKLSVYVAGAAAAAAAGLSGTESAEAVIVNSPGFSIDSGSTNYINFDNAGAREFDIVHRTGPNRVQLLKNHTNAYVSGLGFEPAALAEGTLIGPASMLSSSSTADLANQGDGSGNFAVDDIVGNPQYLGVSFHFEGTGQQYFGWIGVDITSASDLTGRVTGFAYEDSGGAIAAGDTGRIADPGAIPEPVGLGSLAMGAAGIAALRRSRKA